MTPKRLTQRRSKLEKHFTEVYSDLLGGMNQPQIARKYGVDRSAVFRFVRRNADALGQAQQEVVEYSRDVAIANKQWRISELQSIYTETRAEAGSAGSTADKATMLKTALSALHMSAEELGQLPRPDQNINIKAMLLLREVSGTDVDVS